MEDWKALFHSKEDFDRVDAEARGKTQWGRWTLDKEDPWSLDIQPYAHSTTLYQIVLFKRDGDFPKFTEWLGHWVQHIQQKSWLSYKDLWQFVEAAQEIYVYQRGAK
jgi:hypothetical protein